MYKRHPSTSSKRHGRTEQNRTETELNGTKSSTWHITGNKKSRPGTTNERTEKKEEEEDKQS